MASVLLEARPYRPFKSSEEYLEAMREDLAEWLNTLYPELMINADNFMDRLDTGVALCKHANNVRKAAEEYLARRQARNKSMTRSMTSGLAGPILAMGNVHYLPAAKSGTFFARDNVSNFITWCRKSLKIFECLLFETDDLIMRKNEKHVILCLLEVARRGAKFGMLAPMLVQMERQIDREIAADNKANGIGCGTQTDLNGTNNISTETDMFDTDTEDEDDVGPMLFYGPQPQIITNDLKSLDEMVRDLVEKCTCPSQFPMVRVSEGKYRIGDTKVLIFVRILRSHVMVRVGGGWDTLSHYLDKHDPCRCRAQHRTSVAARLIPRTNNQTNGIELHKAQVIFERSPPSARRVISTIPASYSNNSNSPNMGALSPPMITKNRSRSPTPQRKFLNQTGNANENSNNSDKYHHQSPVGGNQQNSSSPSFQRRSISPSPKRLSEFRKKQTSLEAATAPTTRVTSPVSNSNKLLLPESKDHHHHHVQFEHSGESKQHHQQEQNNSTAINGGGIQTTTEISTKFENISDNGSEISDEGYRSLGVIQPGTTVANNSSQSGTGQKRESLHSQTSVEDAELNARLDQQSSDSQMSPTEENSSNNKTSETLESNSSSDVVDAPTISTLNNIISQSPSPSSVPASPSPSPSPSTGSCHATKTIPKIHPPLTEIPNQFEKSGIFITDDEITVDIASATGLRKTGFSDKIYGEDNGYATKKSNSTSKIPRSPAPIRRRSIDTASEYGGGSDLTARTGLPVFNRKQPVYRSVRKLPSTMLEKSSSIKESPPIVKDVTNTWSGRTTKKRPTINNETFTSPNKSLDRNTKGRSSQVMYDSNGRRVKGISASVNTSPVKNGSSPLAQQILEAASSAKNDAQILEKMKKLLTQYSNSLNGSSNSGGGGGVGGNASGGGAANGVATKSKSKPVYDDFTSAWVHSNGTLDRSSSCSPPTKGHSKRSSAASSIESAHSKDFSVTSSSPRKDKGSSRIPAPVRNNTELY